MTTNVLYYKEFNKYANKFEVCCANIVQGKSEKYIYAEYKTPYSECRFTIKFDKLTNQEVLPRAAGSSNKGIPKAVIITKEEFEKLLSENSELISVKR
jgi:hypothetical protein